LNQSESEVNLAKAALHIAQEDYPDLDIAAYLQILDAMADGYGSNYPKKPIR
jgi:hypothetical protein